MLKLLDLHCRTVFPRFSHISAAVAISASLAQGQSKIHEEPTSAYQNEAMVVERSDTTFTYQEDGTGEKLQSVRIKVTSDAGSRQLSVISLPYTADNETPKIEMVRVLHPDGTSIDTPASDAMDIPAPVARLAPVYSDLKSLQIPVRGLQAGDTLEYQMRIQRKNAEAPSQFWDTFAFFKGVVVLAQNLTLDVPAGKHVQVWSPTVKPLIAENAGRRVYKWSSSQLKPTVVDNKKEENAEKAPALAKPEVAWTTFRTWQEVGEWYRDLLAPRMAPTDALRAQADEITRDAKTPEEQIQALYWFVSARVHYVAIEFGIGRYQPHASSEVLINQYGDCKDKDTLLQALLRSKGFNTGSALVSPSVDVVPELPSPGFFNHVITTVTLPAGRIWLDSTPGITPYRFLVPPLRDKNALVIAANATSALERTPSRPPYPFEDRFEAKAALTTDGELKGDVNIDYRSDDEIIVRSLVQNLAPARWDQGTQLLANLMGFSGTTSHSSFSHADDTKSSMHVSYEYTRKPFGDWSRRRILPLFPANTLPAAPDSLPSHEIDLGAVRTESSVSKIRLPEKYVADLPKEVHAKTDFATFDKTYRLENGELIAERKIVVLQSKLPASRWERYKKFTEDISLGEEAWVQLTGNVAPWLEPKDTRATVKDDSLDVYSQMSSDSDSVTTLPHGTVVRINLSIVNGEGAWCSISSVDTSSKLGYVRCTGLQR